MSSYEIIPLQMYMNLFPAIMVGLSTLIPLPTSFLKFVIEGNIEVIGRRARRRKRLLDDLKQTRRYWKLKEALDCSLENLLWERLWSLLDGDDCGTWRSEIN